MFVPNKKRKIIHFDIITYLLVFNMSMSFLDAPTPHIDPVTGEKYYTRENAMNLTSE